MLLEASSEAPATWLDRLWVVSAVRVSVPADASSCTAEAETLETMAPTAASNSSAKRMSSARRAALAGLVLRFLRGGVAFGLGDGLDLELLDRARHLAEFVLAPEAGQHDVEIAGGEFAHGAAHRRHRPGNALAQQERPDAAEQEAAGRQHQDQLLGLADGRMRFRFQPLLVGQQVRLHRARTIIDGGGGLRHLDGKSIDLFGIVDQFGQRLPVFLQQAGDFLHCLGDLFVRWSGSPSANSQRISGAPTRWRRPPGRS